VIAGCSSLEISVDSCCDRPISPALPVALQLIPPLASGAPGADDLRIFGGTIDFELTSAY